MGYPPNRIDLLTDVSGVDFETCYKQKVEVNIDGLSVSFIDLESLIQNKKSSGRTQDLADAENLEAGKKKDET